MAKAKKKTKAKGLLKNNKEGEAAFQDAFRQALNAFLEDALNQFTAHMAVKLNRPVSITFKKLDADIKVGPVAGAA